MVGYRNRSSFWDFFLGAAFVVGLATGAVYTAKRSDAATASVTYSFSSGQKIVASQINQNYNDILGAINGNLNTDNFLDGGIATADLGSSVVTTAKINDLAVTTAKINDLAVTSAKKASANIVEADLAPFGGGQLDNSVIASASITLTVDRPVQVLVTNDVQGAGVSSNVGKSSGAWEVSLALRRNGATQSTVSAAGSSSLMPCSGVLSVIERPGIGTHYYTLLNNDTVVYTTSLFRNCKLQLREL